MKRTYWYAAMTKDEAQHSRMTFYEAVNYVLDETLTLIRMRIGIEAAEKWWTMISDSPRCNVEWIIPERTEKAVRWFFSWRDQSFSFTDCTSFILMKELGLEDVLTGDRHFAAAGFRIHP